MSFRETREMLLLAYDSKIISDKEFVVLWESCRSKNPDFPYSSYARFDLENIHETECLAEVQSPKTRHSCAGKRSSTTNEHPLSTKNNL